MDEDEDEDGGGGVRLEDENQHLREGGKHAAHQRQDRGQHDRARKSRRQSAGFGVERLTPICQRFTTGYGRRGAKDDCASNAAMSSAL